MTACASPSHEPERASASADALVVPELRDFVNEYVENNLDTIWDLALDLHAHPQIAFEETYASEHVCNMLKQQGFKVEEGCAGLSTAFKASWTNNAVKTEIDAKALPRIALFAELDALPELGHACGHNIIATTALLAGMAAKEAMKQYDIAGTVEVYGTPAEEDGGGKIIMLNAGVFDGVDAVYLMHPTSAMTRIGGACTSFTGCYVTYTGKPAHAESHPEEGVNAMDAASLFHQALGVSRQQLPDDVHVCDVILSISNDIGRIPANAKIEVEVSSTTGSHVAPAQEVVERCARGIAMATGCEVEIEHLGGYLGRVPNAVLGDIAREELRAFGEPVMDGMPSDKGGEDLGDVSRVIPACNVFGTLLPERKISGHTPEFRELSRSESGRHCLQVTSKALATSVCALMLHPELLTNAKEELAERIAQEV